MAGKHDKKPDEDRIAKLLVTGPIVIRGMRRSFKDALLPVRPSRHRAFGDDSQGAEAEPTTDRGAAEPVESRSQITAGERSNTREEHPDGPARTDGLLPRMVLPGVDPRALSQRSRTMRRGVLDVGGDVILPTVVPASASAMLRTGVAEVDVTRADQERGPQPEFDAHVTGRGSALRRAGRVVVGVAVLVVLALVCAGLARAAVVRIRADASIAAQEAAEYTSPPPKTPAPMSTGPVVAVIGDSTSSTAAPGVTKAQRWPSRLASAVGGTLDLQAASGMGYVTRSSAGDTFASSAERVPFNAQVVVFFGGAEDSGVSPPSLAKAARDAFSTASKQAPGATVIVIGPAVSNGMSGAELTAIRTTLRSSAGSTKATWVDPASEHWLDTDSRDASAAHLSARDEDSLGTRMATLVTAALR